MQPQLRTSHTHLPPLSPRQRLMSKQSGHLFVPLPMFCLKPSTQLSPQAGAAPCCFGRALELSRAPSACVMLRCDRLWFPTAAQWSSLSPLGGCRQRQRQSRRLSSCLFRQRSSFHFLDESPDPALEITTGWCSGRFRGFSGWIWALAAACLSHISLDFTQISSICS